VIERVLGYADEAGEFCVIHSKNRFRKPLFNGYCDVLVNLRLRLPDGTSMFVELQVHLVQILESKAKTQVFYLFFRTYFCGNVDVVAERMNILEAIAVKGGATAGAEVVDRAVAARRRSSLLWANFWRSSPRTTSWPLSESAYAT